MGTTDKKLNEIIRVKRLPKNYTVMDKGFLEDARLSMKAKGILAYLLSKPNNWKVIVADIVNHCKDGKSAIYAGLKELKENGYYKKVPVRNEEGTRIMYWESTVYEVPNLQELHIDEEALEQEKTFALEEAVMKTKEKGTKKKAVKIENTITKREQKTVKTEQKQPFSLFPNFQEVEKQFIENKERNNNYNTNNYSTKIYSNSSQIGVDKPTLENTIVTKMTELFKRKINYNDLLEGTHESDSKLIDEFVHVALDCLLSDSSTVRINEENKPRELVKSHLMKLTYSHFTYVLDCFKSQRQKIKKKRQYILSMLYNSTMELESHYFNAVATDLGV